MHTLLSDYILDYIDLEYLRTIVTSLVFLFYRLLDSGF